MTSHPFGGFNYGHTPVRQGTFQMGTRGGKRGEKGLNYKRKLERRKKGMEREEERRERREKKRKRNNLT